MTTVPRPVSTPLARMRVPSILVAGLLSLWVALGVTVSMVFGANSYQTALAIWPWGAIPNTAAAAAAIDGDASSSMRAAAYAAAVRAVRREPANVQAVRTLALLDVQASRLAQANRLIDYAQTLSRRDVQTELYLIERFVQADDINGALLHYDHALRTSRKSADVLMPVLVQAIVETPVRGRLAQLLRANPPWRYEFFSRVLTGAPDPDALADLMARARLRSTEPGGATFTRQLVDRLIAAERPAAAFAAYRRAIHRATASALRDGGFETANAIPPIDWWFSDDTTLYAVRENVTGATGDYALRIVTRDGGRGVAARQMLLLPAGRYRVDARIGGVEESAAAEVVLQMRCARGDRPVGRAARALAAGDTETLAMAFTIDTQCPAQWITIAIAAPDQDEAAFWIDDVAVHRLP